RRSSELPGRVVEQRVVEHQNLTPQRRYRRLARRWPLPATAPGCRRGRGNCGRRRCRSENPLPALPDVPAAAARAAGTGRPGSPATAVPGQRPLFLPTGPEPAPGPVPAAAVTSAFTL